MTGPRARAFSSCARAIEVLLEALVTIALCAPKKFLSSRRSSIRNDVMKRPRSSGM